MYYILILLLILLYLFIDRQENMVNIEKINRPTKWGKDEKCKYSMTKVYMDVLKEYSIPETSNDWTIYFPCSYNNANNEINKIKLSTPDQRIFIVNNSDALASKSKLWINLVKKYGIDIAKNMAPNTYVLYDKADLERAKIEYTSNTLYILKKNVQRQEGLKITNDINEIINGYKNGYVVAQELLQDPYTIKGRKINMRFYVLLVCQYNEISLYVHNEGFMYYTKLPFEKNSLKSDVNITTGYVERWIYQENPLSHTDFRNYLGNDQEMVFRRIYELIKEIVIAMNNVICYESKLKNHVSFQLFGADIALNEKLYPKIMEFNVGPNLATHDPRDSEIKHMVVRDIFKTLELIPNVNNKYIRLI
jgi:hypothetical protein